MTMNLDAHGGNIYKEARNTGRDRRELLDYSANINPLGIPKTLKEILLSSMDELINYPDPDCTDLKLAISEYLNVEADRIIIGNGASEIIFLLMEVLKPWKIIIPAPTFSEYAKAAEISGAHVKYFEMSEKDEFRLDMEKLIDRLDNTIDAVMLCNPNNPTSRLVPIEELLRLVKHAQAVGTTVIVDEAFIELTEEGNSNSLVSVLDKYRNLFLIRAFTKYFAVPGLRLGFGLGDEKLIKKMLERKLPWSVNSFACNMGVVLSDKEYITKTACWLKEEKNRFYNELTGYKAFKVFRPDTNFILAKIIDERFNATTLKQKMLDKGILIRNAGNFAFLNDQFVRFAIKDRQSNDKFITILDEILLKD